MTTTASTRMRRALSTTSARKTAINLLALGHRLPRAVAPVSPRFASTDNFWNVLRQISAVLIAGSAVTILMISGGLDLSVGGVLALSGVTAALLSQSLPLPLAFVVAVLVGAGVGMLNGFLTVVIGINAVIATLGTMYVSRGTALLISNGVPVYDVPSDFKWLGTGYVGPVPVPVLVAGITLLVFTILERRTLLGRYSVAVGSNATAAQLSGVPLARTRFILYTLAGAAAGLSGCVWASRVNCRHRDRGRGLRVRRHRGHPAGRDEPAGRTGHGPGHGHRRHHRGRPQQRAQPPRGAVVLADGGPGHDPRAGRRA